MAPGMPPQGPPPPQAAPQQQQSAAPQPPQGQPARPPGGGQSPAAQIVGQIHDGLTQLAKLMDGAGNAVSPQNKQQLSGIMTAFQDLVSELGKPPGQGSPKAPSAGGPMPAHAAPNSKPAPNY